MEPWIALHCVRMSIMANSAISIGNLVVFLFGLSFLQFLRKSCIYFLMIWIMYVGGFSTYARYHILLNMTWFIKIFFFMSDNCKFSDFRVSTQIFFLLFPSFVVVAQLCCLCLYLTLAIFPCILFCYTLCQCLAILYALASF